MRIYLLFLLIIVLACGKDSEPTLGGINRMDEAMMSCKSKEELAAVFEQNPELAELVYGFPATDTASIAQVFEVIQHPEAQKLYQQVDENFGNLETIQKELAVAFAEITKMYPNFKQPRIASVFTGLQQDIIANDTLIVISLESFLGPKALYRPQHPAYMLRRYAPEYIVPNIIRFVSNRFNRVDIESDTFTDDMVFYGKSFQFCRAVLPNVPDSLIIGYSNRDLQNSFENQDYIWRHILTRELLNNADPAVKVKYFEERPYTGEISPDCPGRIGQWLGLRIVELYMRNNPKVSVQELMANNNAVEILRASKYRGQGDE